MTLVASVVNGLQADAAPALYLVLTLEEAAVFMGISRSTLYKMTHNNVIPFYRPNGKLIYFEKSELLAWMRKNRAISQEEVNEHAHQVLQKMAMG